jgi:hypothetical protein
MSDVSPTNIPIRLFSDALFGLIVRAFKVGGFGLVLILIGTVFTLVAFFSRPSIFGYVILFVGVFIILVIVSFFYFQSIRPVMAT